MCASHKVVKLIKAPNRLENWSNTFDIFRSFPLLGSAELLLEEYKCPYVKEKTQTTSIVRLALIVMKLLIVDRSYTVQISTLLMS